MRRQIGGVALLSLVLAGTSFAANQSTTAVPVPPTTPVAIQKLANAFALEVFGLDVATCTKEPKDGKKFYTCWGTLDTPAPSTSLPTFACDETECWPLLGPAPAIGIAPTSKGK